MLRLQCLKIDHEKADNIRNTRFKIYFLIFFYCKRSVQCDILQENDKISYFFKSNLVIPSRPSHKVAVGIIFSWIAYSHQIQSFSLLYTKDLFLKVK